MEFVDKYGIHLFCVIYSIGVTSCFGMNVYHCCVQHECGWVERMQIRGTQLKYPFQREKVNSDLFHLMFVFERIKLVTSNVKCRKTIKQMYLVMICMLMFSLFFCSLLYFVIRRKYIESYSQLLFCWFAML